MLAAGTQPITIDDSVIVDNSANSTSLSGPAEVGGAGLLNGGLLQLDRVHVRNNAGSANGGSGHAQGGGIWNGSPYGFPVALTGHNVSITRNALQAGAGIPIRGGGLYTDSRPRSSRASSPRTRRTTASAADRSAKAGPRLRRRWSWRRILASGAVKVMASAVSTAVSSVRALAEPGEYAASRVGSRPLEGHVRVGRTPTRGRCRLGRQRRGEPRRCSDRVKRATQLP